MRPRHRPQNLVLVLLSLAVWWEKAVSAEGYAVLGYLTYTRFDTSGQPTHKKVLMFDVQVHGADWRIRTEPVIEGNGGIGFYEASHTTNDSILMVTAFGSAYKRAESPFGSLRAALKESRKDDVYFSNPPPARTLFSNVPSATIASGQSANVSNVAVAVVLKGKYPQVDQSYVALLRFAFTPPEEEKDGDNRMLPQIWDDGSPRSTRFRRAQWIGFEGQPCLVSNAVYNWAGKELGSDGRQKAIDTLDVSRPLEMAARYEVDAATNVGGFMLPLSFKLTRLMPERSALGEPRISSIVLASVTRVRPLSSNESFDVGVPGKTYVSDYRFSSGELKGASLGYLIESNTPPSVDEVKSSGLYRRSLGTVKSVGPKPYVRWVLLGFLLISTLSAIVLWKYATRGRGSNT